MSAPTKDETAEIRPSTVSDSATHQEEGTMHNQTINRPKFDTTMTSTVNHGGGIATVIATYSNWLECHDIHLLFGNDALEGNYLSTSEARALAAALLAVAAHIDEEEAATLTRRTDAGQPAFEEGI